ncbi:MFS transporter [Henriciella litoralis]|uniref:MFS transporter n=1 Tax=Henriciella litoralis TaxID=568102 RepID=UPI000A026F5E|nr:MFS transporter [Henriciella litoralis]
MHPPVTTAPDSMVEPTIDLGGALNRRGLAWAIFEWARNPYYILVIIYLFAPYFASIIGQNLIASGAVDGLDGAAQRAAANAEGQATISGLVKYAGFIAAFTAPFLGAALDRGGRRKPLMVVFLGLMAVMSFSLYWVTPDDTGMPIWMGMTALVLASVGYTYSEVTHNSMLNVNGRPGSLPAISGLGLALGNLAGAILMAAIVFSFALPALTGWPFSAPLFGVDVAAGEHQRLVGPICAIWLVVFVVPFFLYTEDGGTPGASWSKAARNGAVGLYRTIRNASENINILKYLGARMLYADGMAALLALGGVYIGLYLEWNVVELSAYAVLASLFAFAGGIFGGWLDGVVGPKRALMIEISGMVATLVYQLSITPDAIFYGLIPGFTIWDGPVFNTLSDVVYLSSAAFIAVTATASISSSRSMLVHLAPSHRVGEFFGLYAIAGTVTVWLGPLLVELFTKWSGDQRIGMSAIGLLFILGFIVLTTVHSPHHPAVDDAPD